MKNYKVQKLQDKVMSSVVGGGAIKQIATATGATITCTAGAASIVLLIAAMTSDNHKAGLYKAAAAFSALSFTGLIATCAFSKIPDSTASTASTQGTVPSFTGN